MKPQDEREALLRSLSVENSEVLVLRGLGSEASLLHLQQSLETEGMIYPYAFYIPGSTAYQGIGFLSSLPFSERRKLNSEDFRIKETRFHPLAGGIKLVRSDASAIWIWNQQAPSPEEPYERRRNDARILTQTLRPLIQNGEEILLSLHSREELDSPMIRILEEAGLKRLVPVDAGGDSWTHRDPQGVNYRQDQWLFATPNLVNRLTDISVLDSKDLRKAGPYRHQQIPLP